MDSQLARVCDRYFRSCMAADPFSATEYGVAGYDAEVPDPSRDADSARMAELERIGAEAARIDPATLAPDERVSRSMLLRLAADEREQLGGRLDELAVSATAVGVQTRVLSVVPRAPLTDAQRARDYLERCRKLGGYLDGVLARHLEAKREGRFPAARGVGQAVAQLDDYLASDLKDDPLLRPEPPQGPDAAAWRAEAAEIVQTVVRPAMGRYRTALAGELAPVARDDDHAGVCNLEGGAGAYDAAVRAHTTTDLAPEVIHRIGLDLLDGLHAEFADLGGRALGAGGVPEVLGRLRDDPSLRFGTGEEILAAAGEALRRAEEALPDAFLPYDVAPCRVEAIDPVEARDAVLGYYLPPGSDGARPGIFAVNTHAPATRTRFEYDALSFHESVPGHHLQFALAQRLRAIPEFRRFAYVTSYCEGWALYCERLAEELGLYRGRPGAARHGLVRRLARLPPGGRHRHARARLEQGPRGRLSVRPHRPVAEQYRQRGRPLHRLARPGDRLHGRPAAHPVAPRACQRPPRRGLRPACLSRRGAVERTRAAGHPGRDRRRVRGGHDRRRRLPGPDRLRGRA
jgi:uncharacterized protein (DUF885 family)